MTSPLIFLLCNRRFARIARHGDVKRVPDALILPDIALLIHIAGPRASKIIFFFASRQYIEAIQVPERQ